MYKEKIKAIKHFNIKIKIYFKIILLKNSKNNEL